MNRGRKKKKKALPITWYREFDDDVELMLIGK
jgi:hypothetical protein